MYMLKQANSNFNDTHTHARLAHAHIHTYILLKVRSIPIRRTSASPRTLDSTARQQLSASVAPGGMTTSKDGTRLYIGGTVSTQVVHAVDLLSMTATPPKRIEACAALLAGTSPASSMSAQKPPETKDAYHKGGGGGSSSNSGCDRTAHHVPMAVVSASGTLVTVGGDQQAVSVYDLATGELVQEVATVKAASSITALATTDDGSSMFTAVPEMITSAGT